MKLSLPLLTAVLASLLAAVSLSASAADPKPVVESLRHADIKAEVNEGDIYKYEKDREPIPREYVQQPPLIPHTIANYNITKEFNKCMDCHSWTRYKETGATKVSLTHFKDRDGKELSNISPRRYFCTQCHVPQTNAKPLVGNTFKRAQGLN
ncbi:nitrate reductase cytochrome c-type subunit [Oryzomicrobium sp.]|uniref:nitrate reductase cytochrome c-type subunit n=1 Tax=Oryzomicrobium sp. TaxID=1911578 RepID=UPI0025F3F77A|nr:nitrate reductase cytochrome c-type subunit [Oryzomicrobium sp.]MCE1242001.1 nitrate reductase cytochrome c-type subunit [Oryzomicrobium sp.]